MNIPITMNCKELEHLLDTPPCPQTHIDLCALEYRKAQVGKCHWEIAQAMFWSALISYTLKRSRN